MLTLPLHGLKPGPLAFSPDGGRLALVSGTQAQVYDVAAGRRLWGPVVGPTYDERPAFTADGRVLGGFSAHGFDARTGQPVPPAVVRPDVRFPLPSPCGRWAAARFGGQLLNRVTGRVVELVNVRVVSPRDRRGDYLPAWGLTPLAFSPDGDLLAGGFNTRLVVLRPADLADPAVAGRTDVSTPRPTFWGRLVRAVAGPPVRLPSSQPGVAVAAVAVLKIPRRKVQAAVFTPDGGTLLAVSNDALVRRWDTTSWAEQIGRAHV